MAVQWMEKIRFSSRWHQIQLSPITYIYWVVNVHDVRWKWVNRSPFQNVPWILNIKLHHGFDIQYYSCPNTELFFTIAALSGKHKSCAPLRSIFEVPSTKDTLVLLNLRYCRGPLFCVCAVLLATLQDYDMNEFFSYKNSTELVWFSIVSHLIGSILFESNST